uniref:KIF-binding protein n=1 Tax=Strigamia maritima TaxID=126957 RepID=T1J432_STRMM
MESMKVVLCNKLNEFDKKCDKYLLQNKGDDFLQKFKDNYEKLYYWEDTDEPAKMMSHYAQAIMNITFFEENKLVEKDFSVANAIDKMQQIIDCLSDIDAICREYTDEPLTLLGLEIAECLLWRRGALLYMYCATVEEKPNMSESDKKYFLKCLHSGINYLNMMINVRKPLVVPKKEQKMKEDMCFLLSEGIYSDTAVLGLMYAGEMCYWFKKYWSEELMSLSKDFDYRQLGKMFLEKYIKTVEGPLKGRGWNVTKAKELLVFLLDG